MGLIMSFKKNDDFYIGHNQFLVTEVYTEASFQVKDMASGRTFNVVRDRTTEIMPNVMIAAGDKPQPTLVRAYISAPRELLVVRGEKFRNPPEKVQRKERSG